MLQFIDSFQMGLPGLTGTVSGLALAVADATLDLDFTKNRFSQPMGPELVDNSGFDNGLAGFTNLSTGTATLTATGGRATGVGQDSANAAVIRKVVTVTAGKTYRVDVSITSVSGGNFRIGSTVGGADLVSTSRNIGVHTNIVTATTTTLSVSLSTYSGGSTYELDYLSIREVNPANLGLELLVNPDFATDLTGWDGSAVSAGVATWSAGQAVIGAHTAGVSFGQNMVNTVAGRQYEASIVISAITAPNITFAVGNLGIGDTGLASLNASTPGEYRLQFIARDSTSQPFVYKGAAGTVTIERMSVREVNPSIETLLTTARASPGMAETMSGQWIEFGPNVPRMTDRGILREESRTNHIANNTMVGAKLGTFDGASPPGALPTGWTASAQAGLTREVVGIGVEDGISYIDYRIYGVSSSTEQYITIGSGPCSPGVAMTGSIFLSKPGGPQTGWRNGIQAYLLFADASNVATLNVSTMLPEPSTGQLSKGRYVFTGTAPADPATTAKCAWRIDLEINAGPVDITVRIGMPQLETGAFATSPIKTTSAAVVRAADSIILSSIAPYVTQGVGTLYADAGNFEAFNPSPCMVSLDDTTGSERIQLRKAAAGFLNAIVVDGGVVQANPIPAGPATMPLNVSARNAVAYATNSVNAASNGQLATVDTAATMPTVNRMEVGMGVGVSPLNGYVKRVAYFARRMTDAELVTLTS